MSKKTKSNAAKRRNARSRKGTSAGIANDKRATFGRSSLARGSDFCSALNRAIKFHREAKEDPHGINNAVWVALTEVRDAMRYALNK